jgi:hypothetical protein
MKKRYVRWSALGLVAATIFACSQARLAQGAQLTGTVTTTTTPINLTTLGSADWAYWQGTTLAKHAQKASPVITLGAMNQVGTYSLFDFGGSTGISYTWSDGNPGNPGGAVGSGDGIIQAVANQGAAVGEGFSINVHADQLTRTLRLYLGEFDADGVLTATLSDGSAPVLVLDNGATFTAGTVNKTFEINYAAASPDQMLTLTWLVDTFNPAQSNSNIFIAGATLSPAVGRVVPEPVSLAVWSVLGTGLLGVYVFSRQKKTR